MGKGKASSTVRLMLPSRGYMLDDFLLNQSRAVNLREKTEQDLYGSQTKNPDVRPQEKNIQSIRVTVILSLPSFTDYTYKSTELTIL